MLGNLMKYEFKATARVFLPLYGALLAMAAVTRLMFTLNWQAPKVISMVLSILLMVAAFVITLILTIQRFYKNFLTSEGYLMFTLPVSTGRLIFGKLIVAVIWTIVSFFTVYLAISILVYSGNVWYEIVEYIRDLGLPTLDLTFFIIEFVVLVLISLATGILTIYASMALSQLSNKHRVALSFVFYIGLNTLMQILTSVVIRLYVSPDTPMYSSVSREMVSTVAENIFTSEVIAAIHNIAGMMLFVLLAFGTGMFFVTRYMLKSKLNLQ